MDTLVTGEGAIQRTGYYTMFYLVTHDQYQS